MNIETVTTSLRQAEDAIERAARHAFEEWGAQLKYIRDNRLYIAFVMGCTWEQYTQERWEMTPQRAGQLIQAFEIAQQLKQNKQIVSNSETICFPTREGQIRPLAALPDAQQRAEVWQRVVGNSSGQAITGKVVEAEVERYKAELAKTYVTLAEWCALSSPEQAHQLKRGSASAKFNETNDNIEWAAWSWNPVTGCTHDCPYCYARDIAARFYPHGFEPTFHPDRLTAPQNTQVGRPRWEGDIGHRAVFVSSMGDLFGESVPQEWIDAVLAAVRAAPQWTFIFLTKNPRRLVNIAWPDNAWVGTTVDTQARVAGAEDAFVKFYAPVKFLSCEPMREPLSFIHLDLFDWVLIGGQSKSTQTPEFQPEWAWVEGLLFQARVANCQVYFKTNLTVRPREYPTNAATRTQQ